MTLLPFKKVRLRYRNKGGEEPGTLNSPEESVETTLEVYYSENGVFHKLESPDLAAIAQKHEAGNRLWINLMGLGNLELIKAIAKLFKLHSLALEDVTNIPQRAKFELYEDLYFIVLRMPVGDAQINTEQISLFVGKNFVLTFQERPGDCLDPIRRRIVSKKGKHIRLGTNYIFYMIVDAVIDHHFPVLDQINDEIEDIEKEIFINPREQLVSRIHDTKRDLLMLRRSIWPHREVLAQLLGGELKLFSKEVQIHLRDCSDHIFQIVDLVETYREITNGMMDLYLSNMGHKVNQIMKILTVMAAIFIPITFISSIYGMNFNSQASAWNMPELNWAYGYPFALSLMAATAISLLLFFKYRRWI